MAARGAIAGLVASLALTRLLSGFLYGVSPKDPPTFAAAALALMAVAVLASYIPARRAMQVDPITVLRQE